MPFDLDYPNLLGCAQCTINRYVPSWSIFIFLRLGIFGWLSLKSVDPVRALGIAALLEFIFFKVWLFNVTSQYWSLYTGNDPSAYAVYAQWFSMIYTMGVIHVLLLITLMHIPFFRTKKLRAYQIRKSFLLIPFFVMIQIIHSAVASGTSTH